MSNCCKILFVLLLLISAPVSAQKNILHLPMAGHAEDLSSEKNHGTILGGVTPTEDRFGNPCGALNFNGTNGFISIPHSASLNSIRKQFSLSTWIKLDPYTNSENLRWLTLICKGEFSEERADMPHYRVQVFQGNTQSTVSINTEFTENDWEFKNHNLEYNKWYHIALTYDGSKVRFYIDANLVWTNPYNQKLTQNSSPVNIGRDIPGATEFFKGSMSDMRLYDGVLNKNQIYQLFANSESYGYDKSMAFSCPKNQIVHTEPGKCYAIASLPPPTAESPCESAQIKQIKGPVNGDALSLGTEQIVYDIWNNLGVSRNCSYTVTVLDKEPPVIQSQQDTVLYADANIDFIHFYYQIPQATDNCGLKSVQLIEGLESGNKFPLGTTTLKFKATDISGNISFETYTVRVTQESEGENPLVDNTPEPERIPIDSLTFEEKLDHIPLQPGSKIEIEDLLFLADKSRLTRISFQRLNTVVKFLNKHPDISIEIGGHTNGVPSQKYCIELSTARAQACYEYLISQGISKERLTFFGYGKSKLKFPADPRNPLNQRVEMTITEVK